jgi:hypothetical protein
MKPDDKDKLNQCISLLESTDLFPSLIWLWTWSTITNVLDDDEWKPIATIDEMWNNLCEAVKNGMDFSLEYGAEQHQEDVIEWMLNRGYIVDFNEDPSEN